MACTLWFCYANGHWKKAKKAYYCYSTGHWKPAKAVAYKRTSVTWQTCKAAPPTIRPIASIHLTKPGNYLFKATITGADKQQWQVKHPGKSWATWSGKTGTTAGGAGSTSTNKCQFRVIATNAWGSTTSNAATLLVDSLPPKISVHPKDCFVVPGNHPFFHVVASPVTSIGWQYQVKGTGAWHTATSGLSNGNQVYMPTTSFTYSGWNETTVRAHITYGNNQVIYSRTAHIHVQTPSAAHINAGSLMLSGATIDRNNVITLICQGEPVRVIAAKLRGAQIIRNGVPVSGSISLKGVNHKVVRLQASTSASKSGNWGMFFTYGSILIHNTYLNTATRTLDEQGHIPLKRI